MKKLFLLSFSFLILIQLSYSVSISSCQNITTSGNYTLAQDLYINSSTCIHFQTDNITLDCNNFKIVGNKTSNTYGIYFNASSNNVVNNCNVYNFHTGILIEDSSYNNISNIFVTNNSYSNFRFKGNSDWNKVDNVVSTKGGYCLGLDGWLPEYNVINNYSTYNCAEGLVFWSTNQNNLTNFKAINITYRGLQVHGDNSNFKKGYIENADKAIDLYEGSNFNTFENIVIVNSPSYDIYFRSWTQTDTTRWPLNNSFSKLTMKNSSLINGNIDFSNNTFTDFYFTDEDSSSVCFPPGLNYACVNNLAYIDTSTNIFPFFENYLLLFTLIIFYLFFS